jgi:hypothetical protein
MVSSACSLSAVRPLSSAEHRQIPPMSKSCAPRRFDV